MDFERARSEEQKNIRFNQIIEATLKQYEQKPYSEISLASIAKDLDFSRANLYKYVSTKEEVFLYIVERDIKAYIDDLEEEFKGVETENIDAFAATWARVQARHTRLLEVLAILHTIIEKNVRVENLAEFKIKFFKMYDSVLNIIRTHFKALNDEQINMFVSMQLSMAMGLHPMTVVNKVQEEAIKLSGVPYKTPEFEKAFGEYIKITLKGLL